MSDNSLTDMSFGIWQRDSDASYRINRACYIIIFESCIQVKARIIGEEWPGQARHQDHFAIVSHVSLMNQHAPNAKVSLPLTSQQFSEDQSRRRESASKLLNAQAHCSSIAKQAIAPYRHLL